MKKGVATRNLSIEDMHLCLIKNEYLFTNQLESHANKHLTKILTLVLLNKLLLKMVTQTIL